MKRFFSMVIALGMMLSLLAGCGGSPSPESDAGGSTSSPVPEQSALAPEPAPEPDLPPEPVFDENGEPRIPLESWVYIESFSDPLPAENSQLACKDETARRLARAVTPLIWLASTAEPPYFDEEHPLDVDTAARIAFDNTRRIDFLAFSSEGYADHPIKKRIDQLREENAVICDVIYAEDAAANLERLFGVADWEHHTVEYYNYFPEEGVYITYADLIRGIHAPQILSWEETGSGYSCEVVLIDGRFGTIGGVEATEENIVELAGTVPHSIYTFDMTTGEPVVTGFQQKQ